MILFHGLSFNGFYAVSIDLNLFERILKFQEEAGVATGASTNRVPSWGSFT